ncbi:MAG: radical SAM protein [Kiritimatiellae bacterium]|nr:radical SAM protein [Kiritimatiellia bacterium]
MNKYRHIFGPVPSRRFGRSLGVDLSVLKTCTIDCVFCQLGRTTCKTLEQKEYVPIEEVKQELLAWQASGGEADYITLSGSGEPTLHGSFGDILSFIKEQFSTPSVLLTNGTLLYRPEVRASAARADVVKISLSAWDDDSFQRVNRPHESLNLEQCIEGMRAFRQEYAGRIWMEVFLIDGVNSALADVEKIARLIEPIYPDEIQLNTAVRPPAESGVRPVAREHLEQCARLFHPKATVIASFPAHAGGTFKVNQDTILDLLRRRPCTARQMAEVFGMHVNEIAKYTGELMRTGKIRTEYRNADVYFLVRA